MIRMTLLLSWKQLSKHHHVQWYGEWHKWEKETHSCGCRHQHLLLPGLHPGSPCDRTVGVVQNCAAAVLTLWHFVQGCQLCPHRDSLGSLDQAVEHVTGHSWRWSILPLCLRLVTNRLDGDQISTAMFRNDHCNHSHLLDCCFWLHVCRFDRAPCIHLQVGHYATCHSQ